MHPRIGKRGISAVITLLATAAFATTLIFGLTAIQQSRKGTRKMELKNVAENFAAELLETFLVMTNEQFAGYLSRLPAYPQPTGGVPAYPLCAHVNLINRAATPAGGPPVILNPDPVAQLPLGVPFENGASPKYQANRFYQVNVVDKNSLAVNSAACGYAVDPDGNCGVFSSRYSLCSNERLMVTVGVSFVPNGKTETGVERVVLTSLVDP